MSKDKKPVIPGGDPPESKPFIRETVINEKPRMPFWQRLILTLILALVFGAVTAVSFYFTQKFLPKETEASQTPYDGVHFSTDEDPEHTRTAENTTEETLPSETAPAETGTAPADDMSALIRSQLESHNLELKDYRRLYTVLGTLATNVSRSLVTVTATNEEKDWFQTEYTFNTRTFCVIVGITKQEVLILAPAAATVSLSESSALTVTFANLTSAGAYTKATDTTGGLAVLAVPVKNVTSGTISNISELPLGNSFACYTGQPVLAMGAPAGYIKSLRYGMLSYVESGHAAVDNTIRVLHTDISGDENSAGFLVNTDGYLIGWIDPAYSSGGCIGAVGISDLKGYIENLTSGISNGYLGIEGLTVTADIAAQLELEEAGGVFITRCLDRGPAQNAGLQSGDIITFISDQPVTDMSVLRSYLLSMNTEQTVTVTILRSSRSRYQELTYDVKIERR